MVLIDSFPFDLWLTGDISADNELTDFPLEDGSSFNDHMINKPLVLSFTAMVSNTPIGEIANHESRRVDEVTEAVFGASQIPLPSDDAYNLLMAIRDEKRIVTIEVPVAGRLGPAKRTFVNMALRSLSEQIDKDTAGGARFQVTFERFVVKKNRRVTVRVSTPAAGGGKGKPKTYSGPGRHVLIDREVNWHMSTVAWGGPYVTGMPYASVGIQEGAPTPAGVQYFYTGTKSADFPYDTTAGRKLEGDELRRFYADNLRAKRAAYRRDYGQAALDEADLERAQTESGLEYFDDTDQVNKVLKESLPPGFNASRIPPIESSQNRPTSKFADAINALDGLGDL